MPQNGTKGTNAFDVEVHQSAAYWAFWAFLRRGYNGRARKWGRQASTGTRTSSRCMPGYLMQLV